MGLYVLYFYVDFSGSFKMCIMKRNGKIGAIICLSTYFHYSTVNSSKGKHPILVIFVSLASSTLPRIILVCHKYLWNRNEPLHFDSFFKVL